MPDEGERLLVPCEGGPSQSRLVRYPPPLEIEVGTAGMYVLDERGGPHGATFLYVFVTDPM